MSLGQWLRLRRRGRPPSRRAGPAPGVESLEGRILLSGQPLLGGGSGAAPPAMAGPVVAGQQTRAALGAGGPDFFRLDLTETGRLTARVHADGFPARLSLLDPQGRLLVQSDGDPAAGGDDQIVQHLDGSPAGTPYYLEVEGLAGAAGTFTLSTDFLPGILPFQPLPTGKAPAAIISADLNGDGHPDLMTADTGAGGFSVFLGLGDGTFRVLPELPLPGVTGSLVAGDFNGDGKQDLAVGLAGSGPASGAVAVLLGQGDGTFRAGPRLALGDRPTALVTEDFNGDGRLDLAVGDNSGHVSVLLGRGDGTFQDARQTTVGAAVVALAAGDFTGDGVPDLAAVTVNSGNVLVLPGRGDGTFALPLSFAEGETPVALVAGDFNGDGRLDLAVANKDTTDQSNLYVTVLLGQPGGIFDRAHVHRFPVDGRAAGLVAGDFNGDGHLDLAVLNDPRLLPGVTVLLGAGDGTFRSLGRLEVEGVPTALAAADFNGDGRLDLATAQQASATVNVLPGLGDGTFPGTSRFAVGGSPLDLVTGDFNRDGRLDVVTADSDTQDVTTLLGAGDGTLPVAVRSAAGGRASALAVADVNGDGRSDLLVANNLTTSVAVLLGLGDGTFRNAGSVDVGGEPVSVVTGDFNGDGIPDLAVGVVTLGDQPTSFVATFLGVGDGTFRPSGRWDVGDTPGALVCADLNGDGVPDLAAADLDSGDVALLFGRGGGTFTAGARIPVGVGPAALVAADFNRDGRLDLAVANEVSGNVVVLLDSGQGVFTAQAPVPAGRDPLGLAAGDVNGDGIPDLVVTSSLDNTVTALLGVGDGTFGAPRSFPTGLQPQAVRLGDFNGDGILDLAVANVRSSDVSLLLGLGDGNFVDAGTLANPLRTTPLVADLNGDGVPDVVTVDQSGRILFRRGLHGGGEFAPPVVVAPAGSARDIALVRTPGGPLLAALDARDARLTFYAPGKDGTFTRTAGPAVPGALPVRLVSGDLNGDGLDDLVVAVAGSDQVLVYFQAPGGGFGPAGRPPDAVYDVGADPADLALADLDGDGRPDVLVADQFSGDVTVLRDVGAAAPTPSERFRAATGLYGVSQFNGALAVRSAAGPAALAVAPFRDGGVPNLVVTAGATLGFALLRGDGQGGFLNPEGPPSFTTLGRPTAVVSGRFHPGPDLDLAVLDGSQVEVFTGDGSGGFRRTFSIPAGDAPTGLSVADVNGVADLVVGNGSGDVLVLLGNGDGTFRPPPPVTGDRVSLDVVTLDNGQPSALVANQQADQVTVQAPAGGGPGFLPVQTVGAADPARQLAPVAVWAHLEKSSPLADAVVVGSGSNDVLVYRTLGLDGAGRPVFAPPQTYFVGTDPVSVTVQDVNGDGIPDVLIADQGSNDITTLFGSYDPGSGAWVGMPGPRLQTGGIGPVGVAVRDHGSQEPPDLVVTNGGSGTLTLLPGVGQGFFNDQSPQTLVNLGGGVTAPAVLTGPGVGVVVAGGGQLVGFNLNTRGAATVFTPPAGAAVTAVQALENGNVVVAERGGGVEELGLSADLAAAQPVESFTPLTGIPSDPSALAILADGSEVLVTQQDDNQIFVFVPAGSSAVSSVALALPPLVVPESPVAEATAPGAVPLTLVLTLEAGILPAGEAAPAPAGAGPVPLAALLDADVAGPAPGADPAGDEDADAPQTPGPPDEGGAHLRIDDLLRQVDLYEPAADEGPLAGVSRLRLPSLLAVPAEVLADCWRAVGEGLMPIAQALRLRPELLTSPLSRAPGQAVPDGSAADPDVEGAVTAVREEPPSSSLPALDIVPAALVHGAQPANHRSALALPVALAATTNVAPRGAELRTPYGLPQWEQALLAALAAGSLALRAEHGSRKRYGNARPRTPPRHG